MIFGMFLMFVILRIPFALDPSSFAFSVSSTKATWMEIRSCKPQITKCILFARDFNKQITSTQMRAVYSTSLPPSLAEKSIIKWRKLGEEWGGKKDTLFTPEPWLSANLLVTQECVRMDKAFRRRFAVVVVVPLPLIRSEWEICGDEKWRRVRDTEGRGTFSGILFICRATRKPTVVFRYTN